MVMRISFKVHSRYEPQGRFESLSWLFHYVLLLKIANKGRRGVLRGPLPMIKSVRVLRRLLLKLKNIFVRVLV